MNNEEENSLTTITTFTVKVFCVLIIKLIYKKMKISQRINESISECYIIFYDDRLLIFFDILLGISSNVSGDPAPIIMIFYVHDKKS